MSLWRGKPKKVEWRKCVLCNNKVSMRGPQEACVDVCHWCWGKGILKRIKIHILECNACSYQTKQNNVWSIVCQEGWKICKMMENGKK